MAAAALVLTGLAPGVASAASPAVQVQGTDGRRIPVSLGEIAALPHVRVRSVQHGQAHVFEGPLLSDLLAKAGAPLGPALRGRALATAVKVTGRDGYIAVLSLAEADPAMRTTKAILADREDGRPLPEAEGPLRLVVEGDLRPARAVRMVESLALVDLTAP